MNSKTNKDYMGQWQALPESGRLLRYALLGLAATILVSGGHYLAQQAGLPLLGEAGKLIVIAAVFALAGRRGIIPLRNRRMLPLICLLSAVAPLVLLAFQLGPVSKNPALGEAALLAVSIGLTALWEEGVFRLLGRLLLEEEGRYKARNFLAMAVIFGAMHLVNALNMDIKTVLIQAAYATMTALFLQTVYTRSGSFLLIVAIHGLMNGAQQLPSLWVAAADRYLAGQSGLDIIITGLFFALSAAIITRRGQLIVRGRPFLNLGKKK